MDYGTVCNEHSALVGRIRARLEKKGTSKACVMGFAVRLGVPKSIASAIRAAPTVGEARAELLNYLAATSGDCLIGNKDVLEKIVQHLNAYADSISEEGRRVLAEFFAQGYGVDRFGQVFTEIMRAEPSSGRVLVTRASIRAWGKNMIKINRELLEEMSGRKNDPEYKRQVDEFLSRAYEAAERTDSVGGVKNANQFVGGARARKDAIDEAVAIVKSMTDIHSGLLANIDWTQMSSNDHQTLVRFYRTAIDQLADLKHTIVQSNKESFCLPAYRLRQGHKQVFKNATEAVGYYTNEDRCKKIKRDTESLDRLYRLLVDNMGSAIANQLRETRDGYGRLTVSQEVLALST